MWPVVAHVAGIKITIFGIVMGVGFWFASWWLWHSMRRDYGEDDILSLTVLVTLLLVIGALGWKFWSVGGLLALPLIGLILWTRKLEWDFWEWLDQLGLVSFIVGIAGSLAWGPSYFSIAAILLGALALDVLVLNFYRKLRWYKSGKTGLTGLVALAEWMAIWIVVAKWHKIGLYWGGLSVEAWLATWAIVGIIVAVYLRSGHRVTHDFHHGKRVWQKIRNP